MMLSLVLFLSPFLVLLTLYTTYATPLKNMPRIPAKYLFLEEKIRKMEQARVEFPQELVVKVGDYSISNYTHDFAREKILPLTAAAYTNEPQKCLANAYKAVEVIRSLNVTCDTADPNDVCGCFYGISHADKAVILSFRGTDYFIQLIIEVWETTFGKLMPSPIGGQVGHYFMRIFQDLWFNNTVGSEFLALAKQYPDYEIWFTGHSLGGAMASIAAAQTFADYGNDLVTDRIKLYTLGEPRTGDAVFAQALDGRLKYNNFRVVHHRDMVAHLPPEKFRGYGHHASEIWYQNMTGGPNYVYCAEGESKDCSNRLYIHTITDHIFYFGKLIAFYGMTGCQF